MGVSVSFPPSFLLSAMWVLGIEPYHHPSGRGLYRLNCHFSVCCLCIVRKLLRDTQQLPTVTAVKGLLIGLQRPTAEACGGKSPAFPFSTISFGLISYTYTVILGNDFTYDVERQRGMCVALNIQN